MACGSGSKRDPDASGSSSAPVAAAPQPPAAAALGGAGSTIARVHESLLVADEDRAALRVVPLPLGSGAAREVKLPGAPAALVVDRGRVLVTVRDPGLLLELGAEDLVERGKTPVAADAWGIAVTPDGKRAVVTSAWSHTVSVVDLAARRVVFESDVAREPRGVVVHPDGDRAYVTHLIGTALTRVLS